VGFLDTLISRPILDGFVSASAAIIIVEQGDSFFGLTTTSHEWEKLIEVITHLGETQVPTMLLGICCLFLILTVDFAKKQVATTFPRAKLVGLFPTPILIVALTILLSWALDLQSYGIRILVCLG